MAGHQINILKTNGETITKVTRGFVLIWFDDAGKAQVVGDIDPALFGPLIMEQVSKKFGGMFGGGK